MERIWTTALTEHVGETICLAGWLLRLRRVGGIAFLVLRDGKGTAQVVVEDAALLAGVSAMRPESVLRIEGTVVAEPQAPGGVEVRRPSVTVISPVEEVLPLDLHRPQLRAQLPTILDHAALSLRHPHRRALFEIAAASVAGFRRTLSRLGFTEIQTPKIVGTATESGANVFAIDYFGRPAYLAQSPQFYKQTMVGVFERVFEVGPVFRAEPHDTARHISEYVSLDAEMGFIADHRDVMRVLTEVLAGMVAATESEAGQAARTPAVALPRVPADIPVIAFPEAQELLYRHTGEDARGEPDLAPAHERWLGAWTQREYGSDFLFVEGYPLAKRPFYTHPHSQDPRLSNSFDLLFRGLELVTGGQRLHRYADYLAALESRGLSPEPFAGYLEAFRYGMPPHGGFALGLERWVMQLAGCDNIREATLFPRDMQRLTP
ncbi:MAG: aspartate--tRNA(Asn) ligase [Anaerolineae bacterium]